MTTRSGPAAASRGQTQKTPSATQPEDTAAGPDQVVKPFEAYGLRRTKAGYELTRVTVSGDNATCVAIRQAEPQRAIAFAYLEAAIDDAYLGSGRGEV